ncbi:MAG: SpoIIE family protein phosphatase, partial [Coriobacteriales bacterium]|nr:SpoIIE family protein phosphatase [Coriobacteriales bacterium]
MTEAAKPTGNRIRDWKGLLGAESRKTRALVFLVLWVAAAAMTFMQFGFIGIGLNRGFTTYILGLLGPIAIAALLLGKGWGTLEGLACGAALFVHARLQPLDLYELYFIGPFNSLVLYTVAGFALGLGFAIVLRRNPNGVRRVAYMAIVSAVVAALTSIAFLGNAIVDMVIITVGSALEGFGLPRELLYAISGMGDPVAQAIFDCVLMLAVCWVSDVVVRKYQEQRHYQSVLTIFRGQLLAIAIIVFVVVQAGAFAYITVRSEESAKTHMEDEMEYIGNQLEAKSTFFEKIANETDMSDLSEDALTTIIDEASAERLVNAYTLDDGTIAIFADDKVLHSNSPAFPEDVTVGDLFGEDSALAQNLGKSDKIQRIVYSTHDPEDAEALGDTKDFQLGYLCSRKVGHYIIVMSLPSSKVFEERSVTMRWASALALVLLAVVYVLAAALLRKVMLEPIVRTNESLAKIANGDLDAYVAETDSVELTMLSAGINTTVGALKDFIDEAERRNERDLATAKTIQESALPRTFPPFPEVDKFDIFASMNAAKEVGGDFYDFFLIDKNTLGFLIADVSGKGIPGALFMMAAKTEIENYLATGMDPAEAIASANKRLCANNDAGMFVTVWAATLNYQTGELTYVNAGHNFPLLRHGSGGEWEWLKKKCGLFLGTFETAKYRQATLTLQPGDELLLYTDGVNEAFNVDEEEYGNDRLETFLAAHNNLHARDMVRSLRADVAAWAEGAEQSDDVTILALEYGVAPEVTGSMVVPATLDHLEEVTAMVDEELEKRLCPVGVQHKVDVALEELFVNVCRYAYANQREPGEVQVSYSYGAEPSAITIELRDQGIPFDPLTREDPTKPSSAQEAKIGGLGIFMVKRSMDDFVYVYDKGSNVVVFKKG